MSRERKQLKPLFTAAEQAQIDNETCRVCGLTFEQHDGREYHRFDGTGFRTVAQEDYEALRWPTVKREDDK